MSDIFWRVQHHLWSRQVIPTHFYVLCNDIQMWNMLRHTFRHQAVVNMCPLPTLEAMVELLLSRQKQLWQILTWTFVMRHRFWWGVVTWAGIQRCVFGPQTLQMMWMAAPFSRQKVYFLHQDLSRWGFWARGQVWCSHLLCHGCLHGPHDGETALLRISRHTGDDQWTSPLLHLQHNIKEVLAPVTHLFSCLKKNNLHLSMNCWIYFMKQDKTVLLREQKHIY